MPHLLAALIALGLTVCAAFTDHRSRVIPNWLTLPALAAGIVSHAVFGGWWAGADAAWSALLTGLVPAFLFVRGALGGGDVKLLAALGAWLGTSAGLEVELCAFLLLVLFASFYCAWHGRLVAFLVASLRASRRLLGASSLSPVDDGGALARAFEPCELPFGSFVLVAMAALVGRALW